jgi:flagellar protein FliO/FliZ
MIGTAALVRGLLSLVAVLGLLGLFIFALRRGVLRLAPLRARAGITIETATSLGDRRSLVIVEVEGRRLLLGLAPGGVSLLGELTAAATLEASSLDRRGLK